MLAILARFLLVEQVWRLRAFFFLGWVPQVWSFGAVAFGPRAPISGAFSMACRARGWVAQAFGVLLLPGFGVSSSIPQVPGCPTSMCDIGVKGLINFRE